MMVMTMKNSGECLLATGAVVTMDAHYSLHTESATVASWNLVAMLKGKQSNTPREEDIMAIKIQVAHPQQIQISRPKTNQSMLPPAPSASEPTGKRRRRQTMGAAAPSRLPQSISSAGIGSKHRLPTPSALPRSVSFLTHFSKNTPSAATASKPTEQTRPNLMPVATDPIPIPARSRSAWRSRDSLPNSIPRTLIPTHKREPSAPIPQRALMSQIQPVPAPPPPPPIPLATKDRGTASDDLQEVGSAQPMAYWLGRYVAISDQLRNTALPETPSPRSISPIPSFQIIRSVSMGASHETSERAFPTRSSSKMPMGCDHLHAMHDRDQRDKRALRLLSEHCSTDAARKSLAGFVVALANARVAKGDDQVAMLKAVEKDLRGTDRGMITGEKKGWLDGLMGKGKAGRERM